MKVNEVLTELNWRDVARGTQTALRTAGNIGIGAVDAMTGSNTRGFKTPGEYEKRMAKQTWMNWDKIMQALGDKKESDGQPVNNISPQEVQAAWKYFVNKVIKVEVPTDYANEIINLTMQEIRNNKGTIKTNPKIGKIFNNLINHIIAQKGANDIDGTDDETSEVPDEDTSQAFYQKYKYGNTFTIKAVSIEVKREMQSLIAFEDHPNAWFNIEKISDDPLLFVLGEMETDKNVIYSIQKPGTTPRSKIEERPVTRINLKGSTIEDFIMEVSK